MSKSFDQIQKLSLSYFKQQKPWIYSTIFLSILTIIIQILNSIFVVDLINPPPNGGGGIPGQPRLEQPPPFIDQATPAIICIVFAVLMLVIGLFSIKLHRTVHQYEIKSKTQRSTTERSEYELISPKSGVTLISIFYLIIDNMEIIRKLSICLYIIFVFYLQWYFRYILQIFGFIPGFPHTFDQVIHFLNFYNQILLIIYVIFDIRRYIHWNTKLNKIKVFEQKIARDFDDELMKEENASSLSVVGSKNEKNANTMTLDADPKDRSNDQVK